MTTDEMLCRWAEQKYDLSSIVRVEFVHSEGWAGTDVTPGYPDEFEIVITDVDGNKTYRGDLSYVPELIREILEFSTSAVSESGTQT